MKLAADAAAAELDEQKRLLQVCRCLEFGTAIFQPSRAAWRVGRQWVYWHGDMLWAEPRRRSLSGHGTSWRSRWPRPQAPSGRPRS